MQPEGLPPVSGVAADPKLVAGGTVAVDPIGQGAAHRVLVLWKLRPGTCWVGGAPRCNEACAGQLMRIRLRKEPA